MHMARSEQYQQSSLPLERAERSQANSEHDQPTSSGINHHGEALVMPSIADDPEDLPRGLASHRLPGDFWPEFHLEWAFREEHGMTPVSPVEFVDMRDWSDGLIEPENIIWPPVPDRPPDERP